VADVAQAYTLWADIEKESSVEIFEYHACVLRLTYGARKTGGLLIFKKGSEQMADVTANCIQRNVPLHELSLAQVKEKYGMF
jgi:hypothetical protein